jgi:hypothetical protein
MWCVEQFQVAHIKVQNVDLIIVFVSPDVGRRSASEQQQVVYALQACATAAHLAGNVVPVWRDTLGRLAFIAPPNQHAFFKSVTFEYLYGNINKKLSCG